MKLKVVKSVNFNRSGSGNIVGRIVLNKEWLHDMNINADEPLIEIFYDKEQKKIIMEKKK